MPNELRSCIDCHETYEAFVFPDGKVAGSGRCPDCTSEHLVKQIPKKKEAPLFNKERMAEFLKQTWTQKQLCCECQTVYDAEYHFNVVGHQLDKSEGRCPACFTTYKEKKELREKEAKEQAVISKREEWRKTCGIPSRYMGERFTTWMSGRPGTVDKIKTLCEVYAEGYPFMTPQGYKSLVITSPSIWGLGKTHLVCAIAHRIYDRWDGNPLRNPIMMLTEPELMARIRATYNHNNNNHEQPETEASLFKKLAWIPLLILDDLGKYNAASDDFRQGVLFRIINERYNNNSLPVIITANMNVAEFKKHLGGDNEAVLDRLLEMCGGKFHEVTGTSYRRK